MVNFPEIFSQLTSEQLGLLTMVTRKIIEIDEDKCTGCGQCVVNCAEGALEVVGGKARVINEHFCDGLGACIGECPENALRIVEREAPEFDEGVVQQHQLKRNAQNAKPAAPPPAACSCPSATPFTWDTANPQEKGATKPSVASEIRQWPLKLRLVPPFAPFFQDMERLVVVSDCASLAYPSMHAEYLRGANLVQVCPKFEDPLEIAGKLATIIQYASKLKEILVVEMEVPCCGHLLQVVREAIARAGNKNHICLEEAVISYKGTLLGTRSYEPEPTRAA